MSRLVVRCAALLLGSALVACSGVEMKPGETARNNREIRQGPGFLTGPSGEFVIFRVDSTESAEPAPQGAGDEKARQ